MPGLPAAEYRVNLFLDGELDLCHEAAFHSHLIGCDTCRQALSAGLALRAMVSEERIQVPLWADGWLFRRIDEVRARSARRTARVHSNGRRVMLMRAAVVVVFVVVSLTAGLAGKLRNMMPVIVTAQQERIEFGQKPALDIVTTYVIYPGIVVEASR